MSLNQNTVKARLQETVNSHSHTSDSWRALLESGRSYPRSKPAVVVSSEKHMEKDEEWERGQRGLAHEVTSEEGLKGWVKVKDVGRGVCEKDGKVCVDAVKTVIKG